MNFVSYSISGTCVFGRKEKLFTAGVVSKLDNKVTIKLCGEGTIAVPRNDVIMAATLEAGDSIMVPRVGQKKKIEAKILSSQNEHEESNFVVKFSDDETRT